MKEYEQGVFLKAMDEKGDIIGSVRAYVNHDTAYIGKLIVHPSQQGKGIGTKLLLAIEQACGASRCELFTSDKSVRNIRLYERVGYTRCRERRVSANVNFIYLEKVK